MLVARLLVCPHQHFQPEYHLSKKEIILKIKGNRKLLQNQFNMHCIV